MRSETIETEKRHNILAFCMDSLRYDTFIEANAPNLHGFTYYQQVYSHAGSTIPSIFALFMNLQWYEAQKQKLVPWLKSWAWVPSDLKDKGYQTAFFSTNSMFKLYEPLFSKFFDVYKVINIGYGTHSLIDEALQFHLFGTSPKFTFILGMETHFPYGCPYEVDPPVSIEHQKSRVELIDPHFKRLVKKLEGTDTDVIVFSDHGDLAYEREGERGHGPGKWHPKLFEIPLGRKVI